ncbi:hypothetical protein HMPREF9943_00247 [Eggerthia catenaformis OT 569 = DSM 20559]|uniref:YhcG PDDEXK nuclease domain-containing protein n=1 Tax=Eggerthia catenaformis OT 569 = DSM 20559 TaxID=999415 RepID=M2Q3J5_9FIRM|nr:PDDEXK nuclease domain-containing protein [Eggerthia catenaformis]EMD17460.1 hypothetical protein HMPREF9943_00247 [Eggerthia catenaformis OT 569 = DSM 20559]
MRVENEKTRNFYLEEAIKFNWSTRQLNRQINSFFYESDLEQALITHLQKFLLELGRGFSFVARQKRFTFDGRHFDRFENWRFNTSRFKTNVDVYSLL